MMAIVLFLTCIVFDCSCLGDPWISALDLFAAFDLCEFRGKVSLERDSHSLDQECVKPVRTCVCLIVYRDVATFLCRIGQAL